MKILLLTAYYKEEARWIGTSYKVAELLANEGNEVVVLTSKAISKRTHTPHEKIKIVETKDIFIKDPLNLNIMPFLFGELSRVIKKEKPDVCIISKYIFFPIIAVPYLKLKGQNVIVITDTYPGVVWFTRSKLINFLAWVHYHIVGRTFVKGSDHLVLTHEELIEPTKNLGINKFSVIHNAIDLKKVDKIKPANDLKKNPGEIYILYVGRLASIKGFDTLLPAAQSIVRKYKKVKFVFAGDQDPIKNVSSEIKDKLIYLGYRKDIISVMKKCDVLVLPSLAEGLPAAAIECMAAGVPVVASDIPGGLNVLVKDKETGLRFRKGDPVDLENKLDLIIKKPSLRKKLGINSRKLIEKDFDKKSVYSKWMKLFEELRRGKK